MQVNWGADAPKKSGVYWASRTEDWTGEPVRHVYLVDLFFYEGELSWIDVFGYGTEWSLSDFDFWSKEPAEWPEPPAAPASV